MGEGIVISDTESHCSLINSVADLKLDELQKVRMNDKIMSAG